MLSRGEIRTGALLEGLCQIGCAPFDPTPQEFSQCKTAAISMSIEIQLLKGGR
jgi:hypothetical protein